MSHCPSKTRRRPHTAAAMATHGVGKIGPWSARPDEDLLVEYAEKGTREAFEELVHRYEGELYGYLRRFLQSAELAEDAFQAAFLQVHLNCRQFDPCRKFRPWLYRIATTRAIDLMRQNRRHKAISLNAEHVGPRFEHGAAGPKPREFPRRGPQRTVRGRRNGPGIRSAVDHFPARLKEVLVLVMFQGLKYQEAADTLGIPLGSVKSRMHEAMLRLRRHSCLPTRGNSAG